MTLSVDDYFKSWRRPLLMMIPAERIEEAFDAMRVVIEHARKAEAEGRIRDMYPLIALCNADDRRPIGGLNLEIRFTPVTPGKAEIPTSYVTTVLKPPAELPLAA